MPSNNDLEVDARRDETSISPAISSPTKSRKKDGPVLNQKSENQVQEAKQQSNNNNNEEEQKNEEKDAVVVQEEAPKKAVFKDVMKEYRSALGLPYDDTPDELLDYDKLYLSTWTVVMQDKSLNKIIKKSKQRIEAGKVNLAVSSMDLLGSLAHTVKGGESLRTKGITHLELVGGFNITDVGLRMLSEGASELVHLNLSGCVKITDPGVRTVALKCPSLTYLNLDKCILVVNEGLAAVASNCKKLLHLSLASCPRIPEWIFVCLAAGLTELEEIDFSGNEIISDYGVKQFGLYCHNLRNLNFKNCINVSDIGILALSNKCVNIESLNFYRKSLQFKVTDVGLLALSERCSYLKEANFYNCDTISDVGVSWIASGCRGLQLLNIYNCEKVTDAGMRALSENCLNLKSLCINNCKRVTDIGVRLIAMGCSEIKSLDLSGLYLLTDGMNRNFGLEGLQSLGANSPHLEHLYLNNCFQISLIASKALAKGCKEIQTLHLVNCPKINTQCLQILSSGFTKLKNIDLSNLQNLVDSGLIAISKSCKLLEIVNLSNCESITDRSIKDLAHKCKMIQDLNLQGCIKLTDLSILAIAESMLLYLYTINLKGIENITETGISWLAEKIPSLLSINVKKCTVSIDGLKAMRQSWRHVDYKNDGDFYGIAPTVRAKDKRLIDDYGYSCKAAIKLQSLYRARRARKEFAIRRENYLMNWVASRLQALWRGRKARRYAIVLKMGKRAQEKAAIRIQSIFRQKQAKKKVLERRAEIYRQKCDECARLIQKQWRGKKVRSLAAAARRIRKERKRIMEEAALKLQRLWRGRSDRKRFKLIRLAYMARMKKENESAVKLQSVCRGRQARLEKRALKRQQAQNKRAEQRAALIIQKRIRKKLIQMRKKEAKEDVEKLERAAIRVQSAWRMRQGKFGAMLIKKGRELAIREKAAIKIQACFRARKGRLSTHLLRQARKIQLVREEKAARFVQRIWRGHRDRKFAKVKRLGVMMAILKEKDLEEWAALKVQSAWRGMKGRRAYLQKANAKAYDWKEMYDDLQKRPFYYNRSTGEIRWRMPQSLLDRLPKPICNNCEWYEAIQECSVCKEFYCETCFLSVHYGGKRRSHEFRSLYDFYGMRIDYGDGEWPSKWPTEIEQDDLDGWFERGKPRSKKLDTLQTADGKDNWGKFYDAEKGMDVYFNKTTGIQQTNKPKVLQDEENEKKEEQGDISERSKSQSLPLEKGNNNWVKYYDESSGSDFYFNSLSNESTYDRPGDFVTPRIIEGGEDTNNNNKEEQMQNKWIKYWDDEGGFEFYYDESNNISTYERPEDYYTPRNDNEPSSDLQLDLSRGNNNQENIDEGWSKFTDAISNQVYYYNSVTGETTYDKPESFKETNEESYWDEQGAKLENNKSEKEGAQNGWVKYWEESEGYEFFYNAVTGESIIDRPETYFTPRNEEIVYERFYDQDNNEFFYNKLDGSSVYERPPNFSTPRK